MDKDAIKSALKETLEETEIKCAFYDFRHCLEDIKVNATSHAKHHEIMKKFLDLIGTLTTGSCGLFVKMFIGAIVGLLLLGFGVWLKDIVK